MAADEIFYYTVGAWKFRYTSICLETYQFFPKRQCSVWEKFTKRL